MKNEQQVRDMIREVESKIETRQEIIKTGLATRQDLLETEITAAQVVISTLEWVLGESGEETK